jgi:hypothetical protein
LSARRTLSGSRTGIATDPIDGRRMGGSSGASLKKKIKEETRKIHMASPHKSPDTPSVGVEELAPWEQ